MLLQLISGRGSPDTPATQRLLMGLDHYVVLQHLPVRPSDRRFDALVIDMRTGIDADDLAGVQEVYPGLPMLVVAGKDVPTLEQREAFRIVAVLGAPLDVRALEVALREVEAAARHTVPLAVMSAVGAEEQEDIALPDAVGMQLRPVSAARLRPEAGGFLSYSELVGGQRKAAPLDPFSSLLEKLVTSSGPESLELIATWLCEWLRAGACVIAQIADGGAFEALARSDAEGLIWDQPFPRAGGLWDRCVREEVVYEAEGAGRALSELAPLGIEGFVAVPVRDRHGRPSGILCVVSKRRLELPPHAAHVLGILAARVERTLEQGRTERELTRLRSEAKVASRQKTGWLTSMVHELRTPVQSILESSELLEHGPLTDEQRRHLGGALQSSREVLALVDEALEIARIDSGKAELYREWTDIAELTASVERRLRPLTDEHKTTVDVSFAEGLPSVHVDPKRLADVLRPVLSSAIDLAGAGGRVTIGGQVDAAWLLLTVASSGVGLAAEDVPHVFRELAVLHDATGRTLAVGTGLGLALAKRIVELCGGFIGFATVTDDGARFSVRLPVGSDEPGAP
jgi:signal transduction histidine kinase